MSVVLQIPCTLFHYFPETIQNLEKLCNSANIPYSIPENQTCCGLPYFEKGEMKAAKTIAEYNLKTFGEDEIICTSLKCEDTYVVKYPKIFNNTVSHNHSTRLANTAKGLAHIFGNVQLNNADTIRSKFFFIQDCATGKSEQTQWLSVFRNAEIRMPLMENTCCGGGFCLPALNPAEAEKMTEALIQQALQSGSDYILTVNEICLQQVQHIIRRNNHAIKSMHIIDLFASAL